MRNNKGFTLIELLAVFVILGVLLGTTIPNIIGITEANKIQTYADDSKRFKNAVEYAFRGDDSIVLPIEAGDCIIANLNYVAGSEFNKPPYGGKYLTDRSIVVMRMVKVKDDGTILADNATSNFNYTYKYYVQLVEEYTQGNGVKGYRGVHLKDFQKLEGDKYLNEISEYLSEDDFAKGLNGYSAITDATAMTTYLTNLKNNMKEQGKSTALCNKIMAVYYSE